MVGKKKLNQDIRRLTILQAAKVLFVEKKYGAITMDEVASRAGMTKRTLYFYFPSKLALFIGVFDENLQQLHQLLVKSAKEDRPVVEVLQRSFNVLYNFTKRNEKFMRLYWTLDSDEFDGLIPEELMQRIKVWTKAMFDEIGKVVKKGKEEGVIQNYDPELLMHLISAINKGIFIHTNKESRFSIAKINPDDLYQLAVNMMTNGLYTKVKRAPAVFKKTRTSKHAAHKEGVLWQKSLQ